MISKVLFGLAATALLACTAPAGHAQTYPSQPIKLLVPFPPGGGTDVNSRLLANRISTTSGWTFVVDNKPGAGGNIGLEAVAKSKPDGYTLGMGQTSNIAINPALYPRMPYDSLKDFAPIVLVASQPVVLVVRQDAPFRTLSDLVATARAKPGALSMASSGSGTVTHLAGEMFAQRAGVKFLHVPYKGASQALTDVLGGQTDFTFITAPSVLPMVRSGKVRALAVSSAKRLPALPDVPTIAESGYKGFAAGDWKALVAPAGTRAEVIERVNAEVNKALRQPELVKKLHDEGSEPLGGTPQQAAQFLKDEHARWGTIVRESGAKVD
jgi:tripartite-type tricarboxylate transporter receptor subunit TctC